MLYTIGIAVLLASLTAVGWLLRMRPIDRQTLMMRVTMKLPFVHLFIKKPDSCVEVVAQNGIKTMFPTSDVTDLVNEVLNFKMRSDDIVVATYPKAGTTWMQEILWLICNNADIEAATCTRLVDRYGFLEFLHLPEFGKGFQALEKWPKNRRRFIKTHMPVDLLPNELQQGGKGKVVCVVRNPKDNCVSFFHFHHMVPSLPKTGSWNEFLTKFCSGQLMFGDWFDYVRKYWEMYQARKDEVFFVSYEELKKDLKGEIAKLAKFVDVDLSEEKIEAIACHCTFNSMSKNKSVNYDDASMSNVMNFKSSKFMRKGEVGDWKNHFTINENIAFDDLYKKRTEGWSLQFEFEPVHLAQ